MNFDDAVEKSSVIRGDHRESFVECLRKVPDFSWILGTPNQHFDRIQGDFFTQFPVVFLKPNGEAVVARRPVMLVNNSCDLPLGRGSNVTVAPVYDLARFLASMEGRREPEAIQNYARDIRQNQISDLIYIPGLAGFSDGAIVRLDMMCSVAYVMLEQAVQAGSRIASFTQNGFYVLLLKLTHHLTRPESYDVTRPA